MQKTQININKFNSGKFFIRQVDRIEDCIVDRFPVVYEFNIRDFEDTENLLLRNLSEYEKHRSFTYRKKQDALRYLVTRAAVRLIIARLSNIKPSEVLLGTSENLKPVVLNTGNLLNFNVSHSGDKVLLAIDQSPIGIDVEHRNNAVNAKIYGERVLNNDELHLILNKGNFRELFCLLWTRKEALVKALGKGIDDDIKRIPALDGKHSIWGLEKEPYKWSVTSFLSDDEYICSLAYLHKDAQIDLPYCKVGREVLI